MFAHRVTLFELFGFKVHVDASWLLLAVLVVWSLATAYFPPVLPGYPIKTYWWMGVAGLIGLGVSIVVHELAHSLVARRFDMPIRGITLFVFGGVAEMEDEPTSAKGELLMAIAGPAMSLAMAIVFALLARIGAGVEAAAPAVAVADYLAAINGILAVFNLLPAFPLDGGRVLRAALWGWKGDFIWATRIAATSGGLFGLLMIALGLASAVSGNVIGGIWMFVLGLFLRAAAGGAVSRAVTRDVFAGSPVRRFMRRDPVTVDPDLSVERLVDDYVYRYYFKSFPVTSRGQLLGCVRLARVVETERERWPWQSVGSVMEPCTEDTIIGPDADASTALEQMQRTGQSRLLVTENGMLVGVLSLRDLLNFLSVRMDIGGDCPMP